MFAYNCLKSGYPAGFLLVDSFWKQSDYFAKSLFLKNCKKELPSAITKLRGMLLALVTSTTVMKMMIFEIVTSCIQIIGGRVMYQKPSALLIEAALLFHSTRLKLMRLHKQSQKVAEKLGFTLEARTETAKMPTSNRCAELAYGLLRVSGK